MQIGISCGEVSGAYLAQRIWPILQEIFPKAQFCGVGIESENFESWNSIQCLAVHGFFPVIKALPHLFAWRRTWRKWMDSPGVKCLILIDYPGFNLRLLKLAQERQIPVLYLAPPQVWIWKSHRIKLLQNVPCLCLFPWEQEYLCAQGITATYVGHPFETQSWSPRLENLSGQGILLLPGSRPDRFRQQLPHFVALARRIDKHSPLHLLIPQEIQFEDLGCLNGFVIHRQGDIAFAQAQFAIAFPGTVTYQLALAEVKTIVAAYLSPWSLFLAKRILREKKWIALPSQMIQRKIFPEIILNDFDNPNDLMNYLSSENQEWNDNIQMLKKFVKMAPGYNATMKQQLAKFAQIFN